MQTLTISEIVRATGGRLLCGDMNMVIDSITTNSREAREGSLFVPLVGETVDAHKFVPSAFELGCSAVIAHSEVSLPECGAVIEVEDTLSALGAIAEFYKQKYRIPTVAVTGSVGKTTTKDIVYAALNSCYNAVKTMQNYNNEIGVPWTIFSQEKEHEISVVEMGMNHFGELERLAKMVKPDAAVITNIGMSHIENLGSQEGILKAKLEVTTFFDKDSTLIVNGDDKFLLQIKSQNPPYKVMTYGIDSTNDVWAKDIVNKGLGGVEFVASAKGREYKAYVSQPGVHNVYNVLAAICCAIVFDADIEKALQGVAHCEYTSGRLEILKSNGAEIIRDCYNASPDSIRAALAILPHSTQQRRVAILGDILEMGDFARDAHFELGNAIVENKVDALITAGENARYIAEGAKELGLKEAYSFDTTEEAAQFAKDFIRSGDCILVKASHGMHFEKIIDSITQI